MGEGLRDQIIKANTSAGYAAEYNMEKINDMLKNIILAEDAFNEAKLKYDEEANKTCNRRKLKW